MLPQYRSHQMLDIHGRSIIFNPSLILPCGLDLIFPLRLVHMMIYHGNMKFYASAPINWKVVMDSMGTSLNHMGISMGMDKEG